MKYCKNSEISFFPETFIINFFGTPTKMLKGIRESIASVAPYLD